MTGSGNAATQNHTGTVITYGPGERSRAAELAKLFPDVTTEPGTGQGLRVTLRADYKPHRAMDDGGAGGKEQKDKGRSAADNPCDDLSYG
ncbi:hypothetical protein [Streptomyces smyrnaeus]|uniref:hypothetical protein n=1 Tax=Streptomyces smyrnaeus TaxID=1387713 RepID=UPI0036EB288E